AIFGQRFLLTHDCHCWQNEYQHRFSIPVGLVALCTIVCEHLSWMSLQNLNDILLTVCSTPRDRVMMHRQVSGWVPISSSELYRNVVGLSRALESWGIQKGDRVAILSENRPEWTIADFTILSLGAITVPIYSTQTAEQTAFILKDSGARVIVVS